MIRRRGIAAAVFAATFISGSALLSAGSADANDSTAGAILGCTMTVDNPHYSAGSGGVIYKTRVNCTSTRTVTIDGLLSSHPLIGPPQPRATSHQQRSVTGGTTATFYTPTGQPGVPCYASAPYFYGTSKMTISGSTETKYSNDVKIC